MAKVKALVEVIGIKPILFHTFPIETLTEKKSKTGEEEWKTTVLMNEERQLYVMNTYFINSICNGGKEIKVGRGNLSKKIASTLDIEETRIYLTDRFVPADEALTKNETEAVYLDVRSVVNPMTKGRNIRYRIASKPGWHCKFTVCWDDYIASKEQVQRCVENGGAFQGVGDGRSIGFGRYELASFVMLKE